jgi:hypothetical protein
MSFSHP